MSDKKYCGWYHNAADTADGPEIRYIEDMREESYISSVCFSDGPFKTFTEAKLDMIAYYQSHARAYHDAVWMAKKLKKPVGK